MLLSLFSGCGGLDLGFEQANFSTGLAYDIRPLSIASWNRNRPKKKRVAHVADIRKISLKQLDTDFGGRFCPTGVIGGPPCQSFTNANSWKRENDPRAELLPRFFELALELHRRQPLDFIVMENVPEVANSRYCHIIEKQVLALQAAGFECEQAVLNAADYGVPQNRRRLFLVALNRKKYGGVKWKPPAPKKKRKNVRATIENLPEPTFFSRDLTEAEISHHPNHWCMVPKSRKFTDNSLEPGRGFGRSFKMLNWEKPSFTVSYGNREVHVHPSGHRRLSVHEAMLLQGFPKKFVLTGTLSSQITQVSEAVPPPLAKAIARSIFNAATAQGLPQSSQSVRAKS